VCHRSIRRRQCHWSLGPALDHSGLRSVNSTGPLRHRHDHYVGDCRSAVAASDVGKQWALTLEAIDDATCLFGRDAENGRNFAQDLFSLAPDNGPDLGVGETLTRRCVSGGLAAAGTHQDRRDFLMGFSLAHHYELVPCLATFGLSTFGLSTPRLSGAALALAEQTNQGDE
jgi:hypothetical protein